jgi:hypothetical protein
VLYHQDNDLVDLEYDVGEEASIPATFHEVQPLESRDYWTRFWWAILVFHGALQCCEM